MFESDMLKACVAEDAETTFITIRFHLNDTLIVSAVVLTADCGIAVEFGGFYCTLPCVVCASRTITTEIARYGKAFETICCQESSITVTRAYEHNLVFCP